MAKIIGIDLGTTYSAVAVWDEKRKVPIIISNLRGNPTTPSVVSLNEAGEVIVGEDAKQNLWAAPQNTVSKIKREMGQNFKVTMGGEVYNPQTISAFILRYLKMCAEKYLGEPVYDAVITVPAYFTAVQKSATSEAGQIAGLNVHRLINEPTAAAIAYGVSKAEEGQEKTYVVYDFGGGTFDVSIIEITTKDVTVIGTGGDMRLGGLDMDEEVMKWAVREIKEKYGVDLSANEAAKQRLKVEAESVKKMLVVSETATLNVPFLTVIDGKPLNVSLQIPRARFEVMITPLLKRSLRCLDKAVASAKEHNQRGWEDLDGVVLVGGPTRLQKIRDLLRETLKEHCPERELEIRSDLNPDEVVAMGAAIVAAKLLPIGRPPEVVGKMTPEEIERKKQEAEGAAEAPEVKIYDVTGHSLGIALKGAKFHKLIEKETVIPYTAAHGPFTNEADYTTELLVEVYQGESEYVVENTKIGEVKISGLDPLPSGKDGQLLEVKFTLDLSGTLSTVCTDLRTRKVYEGTFTFDGITRMSAEDIRKKRGEIAAKMAGAGTALPPSPAPGAPWAPEAPPAPLGEPPLLAPEQVPAEWRDFWLEGQERLPKLAPAMRGALIQAMTRFANAVLSGNRSDIEDKAYLLQDVLAELQL